MASVPLTGRLSDRGRGYLIGMAAVLTISPDAMLLRLPHPGEQALLVTATRCSWVCLFSIITVVVQERGVWKLAAQIRAFLRPILLLSLITTVTAIGFPLSLQLTGSAEALLLIALNPMWGALIGKHCLGDNLPLRTQLALAGALASILLIFAPRIMGNLGASTKEQQYPNRMLGDAIAFATGWGLAGWACAVRYAKRHYHGMPIQCSQVLSNFNAALVCVLLMSSSGMPMTAVEPDRLIGLTCIMGLMINTAYLGFNTAPRYLIAAEFGIICLLETVLGPVWVFLATGEAPTPWTLVGGSVLLLTLVLHEFAGLYATKHPLECRAKDGAVSVEVAGISAPCEVIVSPSKQQAECAT
jgi:drug/metabolite transporter (DMT)-like permease